EIEPARTSAAVIADVSELAEAERPTPREVVPSEGNKYDETGRSISPPVDKPAEIEWIDRLRAASPFVVFVYLLGVVGMLVKLGVAIYGGQRLRRACRPVVERGLVDLLAMQARRLGLRL